VAPEDRRDLSDLTVGERRWWAALHAVEGAACDALSARSTVSVLLGVALAVSPMSCQCPPAELGDCELRTDVTHEPLGAEVGDVAVEELTREVDRSTAHGLERVDLHLTQVDDLALPGHTTSRARLARLEAGSCHALDHHTDGSRTRHGGLEE
jgi:hypothetical protein